MIDSYKRSRKIWESLNNTDRLLVSPRGNYVDSDKILYRKVLTVNNEDVGFVDIYKHMPFSNSGFVLIAVKDNHRGKGYAETLLKDAINDSKELNIKKLIYRCEKTNLPSIELAKKCGFTPTKVVSINYCEFCYNL